MKYKFVLFSPWLLKSPVKPCNLQEARLRCARIRGPFQTRGASGLVFPFGVSFRAHKGLGFLHLRVSLRAHKGLGFLSLRVSFRAHKG